MIINRPNGKYDEQLPKYYGDVVSSLHGISLTIQPARFRMRKQVQLFGRYGLAKHLDGLSARIYLRQIMMANSYDMLDELLTLFPNHVIEFMVCRGNWGHAASS